MVNVVNIIIAIVSAVIIVLVMLQGGHNDGMSSAFTGKKDLNLFAVSKERGSDSTLTKVTAVCGIVFFVCEALIRFIN